MTLNVKLNMDESGLGGGPMGRMGSMMGRIGSSFDYRTKYNVGESGKVEVDKASVTRQKAMLGSVEGLAKAIPGGGLMTTMAKSFMKGGPIGLIATGMTAAVSTLTAILKGSQTYQTLSKTFFTILGAMGDMFLMPFVPMAMKGFQAMLDYLPEIREFGKKAANFLQSILGLDERGKQRKEDEERVKRAKEESRASAARGEGGQPGKVMAAYRQMWENDAKSDHWYDRTFRQKGPTAWLGKAIGYANVANETRLLSGRIADPDNQQPGRSARDAVNSMTDPASTTSKKIKDFAVKEKQTEKAFWQKWYDAMFGNSIVPDTFATIKGMYGNVANEASTTGKEVAGESGKNQKKGMFRSLVDCLKGLGKSVGTFIAGLGVPQIPLPKFSPPSIDTIKDCLKKGAAAVGGFFTETLPGMGKKIVDGIVSGAASIGGAILSSKPAQFIISCSKKAYNAFQDWWGGVKDWFNNAGDNLEKESANQRTGSLFGAAMHIGNSVWSLLKAAGNKAKIGLANYFGRNMPVTPGMAVTDPAACGVVQPPVIQVEELVGQQSEFIRRGGGERIRNETGRDYDPHDDINTKDPVAQKGASRSSTVYHEPLDKGLFGQERGYFANIGAAYGDKFGNLGRIGGMGSGSISYRPTEINIYSDWSPSDIVADIDRMAVIDDASYFNGVM